MSARRTSLRRLTPPPERRNNIKTASGAAERRGLEWGQGGERGGGGGALRAERRDRAAGRKAALFALPAAGGPEPGAEGWRHARYVPQQETTRSRSCADLQAGKPSALPHGAMPPARGRRREHDPPPPPPPPTRSRSRRRRERGRAEPRPASAGAAAWGALAARARAPLPPACPRSHEPPPASASFPRAAPRRFLLPGCAPPRLRTGGPSACSRSRQPRAGRAERRPQTAEGGPGVQSPPCPAPSCPASLTASYSRRRVSVRPRLCRSCARRRRSTEATSAGRACDRAELRRGDAGPPLLLSAKCVYERDVELVCELMCNCCKCTASDTADLQTEPHDTVCVCLYVVTHPVPTDDIFLSHSYLALSDA